MLLTIQQLQLKRLLEQLHQAKYEIWIPRKLVVRRKQQYVLYTASFKVSLTDFQTAVKELFRNILIKQALMHSSLISYFFENFRIRVINPKKALLIILIMLFINMIENNTVSMTSAFHTFCRGLSHTACGVIECTTKQRKGN